MKINNRVWLVIVPVIVLAYAGICTLVYQNQKHSYIKLEQSRLEAQLERLRDNFLHDQALALQFASALLESPALHTVLLQNNSELSEHAAARNLNKRISTLTSATLRNYEVTVVDTIGQPRFFYSDSHDPFATLDTELAAFLNSSYLKRSFQARQLMSINQKYHLLVAFTLDPLTMKLPAGERWSEALLLGFMITLSHTNTVLDTMLREKEYLVSFNRPELPQQRSVSGAVNLAPNQALIITRNPFDIEASLGTLALRLSFIVMLLSLFTSLLLGALIRRFITTQWWLWKLH